MCGLCVNYTDTGVFCEPCLKIHETEKFVAAQSRQLDHGANPSQATAIRTENSQAATPRKRIPQIAQGLIIAACFAFIFVRFYFSESPTSVEVDTETLARELELTALVRCMLVFKVIGEILQTGEMPDPLLGCEQADEPNLISREGDIIRISHPDPGIYGYREIFVTSSDPEPSLIE